MALNFWELGVSYPLVYNRSFRNRAIFESTLNGAVSSSSNTIIITRPTDGPNADGIFPATSFIPSDLNKIVLGPSTNSNNIGAVEEILVLSVLSNTITTLTNTIYAYSSGDPITLYGTAFPDGWIYDPGVLYGHPTFRDLINNTYGGYDDIFSLMFNGSDADGGTIYLTLNKLIANVNYSFSMFYCQENDSGKPNVNFILYDGNGTNELINYGMTGGGGNWYEYTTNVTSSSSQTSNAIISFEVPYPAGSDPINLTAIDCINLQFGWLHNTNGKYIFTSMPSDIIVKSVKENKLSYLLDGYNFNVRSSDKILYDKKWIISCRFNYVPSSSENLFQTLSSYLAWQNRGYLLSLRTYLPGLPPFLVGKMSIESVYSYLHDTGVKSFNFVFEEMI